MPDLDRHDVAHHRMRCVHWPDLAAPVRPVQSSGGEIGSSGLPSVLAGAAAPRPLRAASPTEVVGARVVALGIGRRRF
ncbi:MAG: hypothetical protein HY996_07215 [Micrococcales bacterium]|nr:hypothetical protein [Micrococcales bacterium]